MAHARLTRTNTFNATEAKNRFGAILKAVDNAQPVFIEKHGTPQAVILDIASYNALIHKTRASHEIQLDALREEFEVLYARMQAPRARKATDALFAASVDRLARTAAKRLKGRG